MARRPRHSPHKSSSTQSSQEMSDLPHTSSSISVNHSSTKAISSTPQRKDIRCVRRVKILSTRVVRFLTSDMWHIDSREVKGARRLYLNALKSLYMAIKGYGDQNLASLSSALTYRTLLSIVPMLAMVVSIAKGFGVQEMIYTFLRTYMPGHQVELDTTLGWVENYLKQVRGGVFFGIGFVMLLYTLYFLLDSVEGAFNQIWEVPRGRRLGRKVTDYITMLFFLPIMMTMSSGVTLMMTTLKNSWFESYTFFSPFIEVLLHLVPFVISILMIMALFMALPHTRVKVVPALISSVLAGVAVQILQALYMSGILWISQYSAVYGGFAAIPLFLLWMQVMWSIILFCAKLCFSIQNVKNFTYAKETPEVSHRYEDFQMVVLMGHIVQRFLKPQGGNGAYDLPTLSDLCYLPIAQTSNLVSKLLAEGLITEIVSKKGEHTLYMLSVDPSLMTVGYLLERIDRSGERGRSMTKEHYSEAWNLVVASRQGFLLPPVQLPLSELPLED